MSLFYPEKIYVEQDVGKLPLTTQIISRCSNVAVEEVPSAKELIAAFQKKQHALSDGKKVLLLAKNRGRFLEPCPGTKQEYRCCGYAVLNMGTGCPLDCAYCVLQAYLNNPLITLYVNTDDMLSELQGSTQLGRGKIVRIGTGEYMDSLALEHLTDFSHTILPFLRSRDLILELKTKTTHIEHLLDLEHDGALMVSWSLNAEELTRTQEQGAAPVRERILAARTLVERGYRVGFHFDPLILYPGWQEGYRAVIGLLQEHIPAHAVAWVSIGSLRYMPALKQVAQERFPATKIYTGEFVPGLDNKMRYLQDIRLELYREVVARLREYAEDLCIYFCMEHPAVWQKILGYAPASNAAVKHLLDERVTGL